MKILCLCFCAVLFSFWAPARATEPPFTKTCSWPTAPRHAHTHTVGLAAGFSQGLGFTYKYWFERNGFQATLLPIISLDERSRYVLVSAAPSWLHALWESPLYDFFHQPARNLVYSYLGTHYLLEYSKDDEEDPYWRDNALSQQLFLGGGLGLQMNLSALQFNMGVGFATSWHDERHWDDYITPKHSTAWMLHPSVDASLGYTFGW